MSRLQSGPRLPRTLGSLTTVWLGGSIWRQAAGRAFRETERKQPTRAPHESHPRRERTSQALPPSFRGLLTLRCRPTQGSRGPEHPGTLKTVGLCLPASNGSCGAGFSIMTGFFELKILLF